MIEKPEKHPDDVVIEMIEVATKHGYGVEIVRLSWLSGVPKPKLMRLEYGVNRK